MKGISVVVCCYNSVARIGETLMYLSNQKVPADVAWEIVLVDNASTDHTADFAREHWTTTQAPSEVLRIVSEPQPGLSFAKDKGASAAKYDYLVFCDDDNWLDPEYLANAYAILESDPKIGAAGGQSYAVSDVELPAWFEASKAGYAIGKQGEQTGDVTDRGYLWGAGVVTRKELYQKTITKQYPSLLTGRKGNEVSAGEDAEYCLRLILQGYRLYYSEALKFAHFIHSGRLTEDYLRRLQAGFEVSYEKLGKYFEAIEYKNNPPEKRSKLINGAIKITVINLFKRIKMQDWQKKVLFYYLGLNLHADTDLKTVKHFYNLGAKS